MVENYYYALLHQAQALLQAENIDGARSICFQLLKYDPSSKEAYLIIQEISSKIGNVKAAHRAGQLERRIDNKCLHSQENSKSISSPYKKQERNEQISTPNSSRLKNLIKSNVCQKLPLRIVIGASGIYQKGWLPTEIQDLNLLDSKSWSSMFDKHFVDAILAEHVWEHLTEKQGRVAAKTCYSYLKEGGYIRIAVPDGFNPDNNYIEAVKPGGKGWGAGDHKILYNHKTIKEVFELAGFKVNLLEYFDESGEFHYQEWNPDDGFIQRSMRFDQRNQEKRLGYTSIILDAVKVNSAKSIRNFLYNSTNNDELHPETLDPNYLQSSGWYQSLNEQAPVNKDLKPIPWYTYPAIEFIEGILQPYFKVFEYGSGNSTIWYSKRVETIVTVENNKTWYDKLSFEISKNKNVELIYKGNLLEYPYSIQEYPNNHFDIIVIDGRSRNLCTFICWKHLNPNGIIIFDNTDRHIYNDAVIFLLSKGFKRIDFYGLIPSLPYKTCTSIFFKRDQAFENSVLPSLKESCLGYPLGYIERFTSKKKSLK